jgi:hypothetical protein
MRLIYYIFVNCSWVGTQWQQYSSHSLTKQRTEQNSETRYSQRHIRKNINTKIQQSEYVIYRIKQKHTKHTWAR